MKYLTDLYKHQLFKVSSLNTISVAVRIAGGLLTSKIISLFLGPSGLALIGNFRSFLTAIDTVSTLGFQNGIIKSVAETQNDEHKLKKILSTIFLSVLGVIVLIIIALTLSNIYWSKTVFSSKEKYRWIFNVLAFSLPFYSGNIILMSILNGLGKYKKVIFINIGGNIFGVLLSAILIWQIKVSGALLGLIIAPALLFLFSYYQLNKQLPLYKFLKFDNFDSSVFKGLLSYSLMSIVSAVLGAVVFVSIRNNLYENVNPNEAGFWEAINRMSAFYLMFPSTLLTVYFLPQLSTAKDNVATKKVFYSYLKFVVPIFCIGLIFIYFLRHFVVRLLFSKEFLPMTELFFWQLSGDGLKVASFILGYEFFAKKMTKAFVVTEVLSFIMLYISSFLLISHYGSEGAVMAHALTYAVLLVSLIIIFRKKLF